ncbi:unnamed protein product [Absidia cylindrospora]
MSSPFIDAFRTAHSNATKEFDQFYDYVSQVMTPRRSQQQANNNTIHKTTPKTTKKIRQELNRQHYNKNATSWASNLDQHSLLTEKRTPYQDKNLYQ